jgi:hypothetical protein
MKLQRKQKGIKGQRNWKMILGKIRRHENEFYRATVRCKLERSGWAQVPIVDSTKFHNSKEL